MRRPRSTTRSSARAHRRAAHAERAGPAVAAASAEGIAVAPTDLDARGGTPRRSLTIWAKAVSLPWPIDVEPVNSETEPSAFTRTSAGVGVEGGVRPAGHLDRIGDAEPAELPALPRLARGAPRSPAWSARRQRHVHAAREIAAVVGEDEAGLERHGPRRDEVPAPQLDRVQVELARGHVDDALDGVGGLGPAGARGRARSASCC